jgi:uncharacterized RDD family membrane protein YckC
MAPLPPPPPPPPPPSPPSPSAPSTQARESLSTPARLPRLEDFPEAGPNALASIQQRGFARVIDELMVSIPILSIVLLVQRAVTGVPLSDPAEIEMPILLLAIPFAVQVVYEVVVTALWGQTLGKLALGIRVARYTDGGKPTWTQSSLRCLLWAAPAALGLAVLHQSVIGAVPVFLTALRYSLRRGVHDEAGGTIVVRTR